MPTSGNAATIGIRKGFGMAYFRFILT